MTISSPGYIQRVAAALDDLHPAAVQELADGWRVFAAQRLRAEQTNQFLPDGVQNELTARYHGVALGNILAVYDLAATNNRQAELPADYVSNMEKSYPSRDR